MATKPPYVGGLGFGFKWDMGWMHDTLKYIRQDPVHRKYHHNELTFRSLYTFSENFVMPLSHDEVVHGKSSLLAKMPGDDWQKFANLRLLLGYMYAQPGKKLLFMGGEIGQWREWDHNSSLDWNLLEYDRHQGLRRWVEDINRLYRNEAGAASGYGTGRIRVDRRRRCGQQRNFLPAEGNRFPRCDPDRLQFHAGAALPIIVSEVPEEGYWKEILNSDAKEYWGSGMGNLEEFARTRYRPTAGASPWV